jgi:hypothetical protein
MKYWEIIADNLSKAGWSWGCVSPVRFCFLIAESSSTKVKRGIGLSSFVAMQSLKPAQLAFFSYAHEDAEFALCLAKDLRAGGAAVWMDRLDIKPGERWDRAIEDALAKCPQMLVILSPAAVESTNVMDEVSLALEEGKTVLPVIHRNCKVPFRLRRLQHVDLTLNYKAGVGRLLETLGFATPSSEMPAQDVERDVAASSDRGGGIEEINLLSPAASQEHKATLPMPKKRVFGWVMATIGIVAVLVGVVNVLKQREKKARWGSSPLEEKQPEQAFQGAVADSATYSNNRIERLRSFHLTFIDEFADPEKISDPHAFEAKVNEGNAKFAQAIADEQFTARRPVLIDLMGQFDADATHLRSKASQGKITPALLVEMKKDVNTIYDHALSR